MRLVWALFKNQNFGKERPKADCCKIVSGERGYNVTMTCAVSFRALYTSLFPVSMSGNGSMPGVPRPTLHGASCAIEIFVGIWEIEQKLISNEKKHGKRKKNWKKIKIKIKTKTMGR